MGSPHSGHFIPGMKAPGMNPHFTQMLNGS
jgi:hypothetical protein